MPESDPEVGDTLAKVFRDQGSEVFCGTQIQRVGKKGKKKKVEFLQNGKKRSVEAEQILQALGREPDLDSLNLWTAGVKTEKGKVVIQPTQQTNVCSHPSRSKVSLSLGGGRWPWSLRNITPIWG